MKYLIMILCLVTASFSIADSSPGDKIPDSIFFDVKQDASKFADVPQQFIGSVTGDFGLRINGKVESLKFQNGGLMPQWQGATEKKEGLFINDSFQIPVAIGTRKIDYKATVIDFASDGQWVSLKANTYLEVTIDKRVYRFFDRNINGSFLDYGDDMMMIDQQKPMPLNSMLQLGGALYKWGFSEDGTSVALKKYDGKVANLTVDIKDSKFDLQQFIMTDKNSKFFAVAQSQSLKLVLPVGKYAFRLAVFKYGQGRLVGVSSTGLPTVDIKEGNNSIAIGPPFKLTFDVIKMGKKKIQIEAASLIGVAGESYQAQLQGGSGSSLIAYQVDGTKKTEIYKLEYG